MDFKKDVSHFPLALYKAPKTLYIAKPGWIFSSSLSPTFNSTFLQFNFSRQRISLLPKARKPFIVLDVKSAIIKLTSPKSKTSIIHPYLPKDLFLKTKIEIKIIIAIYLNTRNRFGNPLVTPLEMPLYKLWLCEIGDGRSHPNLCFLASQQI